MFLLLFTILCRPSTVHKHLIHYKLQFNLDYLNSGLSELWIIRTLDYPNSGLSKLWIIQTLDYPNSGLSELWIIRTLSYLNPRPKDKNKTSLWAYKPLARDYNYHTNLLCVHVVYCIIYVLTCCVCMWCTAYTNLLCVHVVYCIIYILTCCVCMWCTVYTNLLCVHVVYCIIYILTCCVCMWCTV